MALRTLQQRSSGLLLHLTSLPSSHGIGDLGPAAHEFASFLQASGQSWWQMLPAAPAGEGNCPYMARSTFAWNPYLISLEFLAEEGLLSPQDLVAPAFESRRVDYGAVEAFKGPRLRKAFENFVKRNQRGEFEAFCRDNAFWVEDYAFFAALKQRHQQRPWYEWEPGLRSRQPQALHAAGLELKEELEYQRFLQYQYCRQWGRLKDACREKNVGLIGDLPIFVSHDSAEVWAHPELFNLGPDWQPVAVAGVPPDYFSETGQRWGNPLYAWERHRADGYGWWIQRFKHLLGFFDVVRVDHFIGFQRYWEIPASSPDGRQGRFQPGPGADLFEKLSAALGWPLPLIAEDLGVLTDEAKALRDNFALPGMRVLQFAFGGDPGNECLPHLHVKNCVVYTGTHDNNTTQGWLKDPKLNPEERQRALEYADATPENFHWDLIRLAMLSVGNNAIIPVQDLLGLDAWARMNIPQTAKGNWEWRVEPGALTKNLAEKLRHLTQLYFR